MPDVTTVLLDLDGVLVDNVAFEKAVTDSIVQQATFTLVLPEADARERWDRELAMTAG